MQLQINLMPAVPLTGYEPIGTLTNEERYYGHRIQGYTLEFFRDQKTFEISLENHKSAFFSEQGRFKIYKNTDSPSQLIAVVHAIRTMKKAKSDDLYKSRSTIYIPSGMLKKRPTSDARHKRSESLGNVES
jgi:hypothetical protein